MDAWLIAAGEGPPAYLAQVVALLVGGAVIAFLGFRIGLVPIVGFLLAGVVIGPSGLGVVEDREMVDAAAEVGVILLLFTIGMEFSLERLNRIRRLIFVGGTLQVGLVTAVTVAVLMALGVDWRAAVFTGLLVSLSSTAIVLKLLADRGEMRAPHGQVGLGLLLFQDLAVVLMVLLVPALGGTAGSPLDFLTALATAAAIIAAVLIVARRVMPMLLERVARTCSPEVFLLSVIAICFGTAYGTSLAGVSVSLGAFLAGLMVSESRFDQQALGEVLPLQIVFSAVFFVSVGMLLDLGFLVANLPAVLAALVAIVVVKAIATAFSARVLGYPAGVAVVSGLMLAQVGEFSFVLERVGAGAGLSPAGLGAEGAQGFIAATVLLMVATPALLALGSAVGRRLTPGDADRATDGVQPDPGSDVAAELEDHVIVAGYGQAARGLTRGLRRGGVPHVVVTLSPDGAAEAVASGVPALLGDPSRSRTLQEAGLARARFVVVGDDEPGAVGRIASVARNLNPECKVLARARYRADAPGIEASGAHYVVAEDTEADAHLTWKLLHAYDVGEDHIQAQLAELRRLAVPIARHDGDADGPAASNGAISVRQNGRTVVDTDHVVEPDLEPEACPHAGSVHPVVPSAPGCEECLRSGGRWVHLRLCLTCGHVGCCDSSPERHARRHHEGSGHHVIHSAEPGEDWSYCFEDERMLEPRAAPAV